MEEIWKDIKGYEGKYQVSSEGRVRSLCRIAYRSNGSAFPIRGRILSQFKTKNGYMNIDLGTYARCQTHRLVAMTFIKESDLAVDHINGIKTDNRLCNLEFVTYSENNNRAYARGLMISGEKRSDSKLTEKDVGHIRDEYNYCDGKRGILAKLSRGYGVSESVLERIVKRKAWKHVR